MNILFINGSPNKNGNTAKLAKALMGDLPYETLQLVDYRINCYGQELPGDQFDEVIDKIKAADVVVFGSPVYWHNICGSIRNLLDRFYLNIANGSFSGKKLFFLFQGGGPQQWMLDAGKFTMHRITEVYGFEWCGMATTVREAQELGQKLK